MTSQQLNKRSRRQQAIPTKSNKIEMKKLQVKIPHDYEQFKATVNRKHTNKLKLKANKTSWNRYKMQRIKREILKTKFCLILTKD